MGKVRIIASRFAVLILDLGTTPTRAGLAIAAFIWSLLLYLPGDTFSRPVYRYMAGAATEQQWAALWAVYCALMLWRIFSSRRRVIAATIVNTLGLCLFGGAAVAIFETMTYPWPAAIAPDVTMALMAMWVLVRTGLRGEEGWRSD